ncbi:MAG TPA: universal stress protein [Solirubrobacterales bacterium]|nr:universal stress protein [Solirubrobacterales bacterium]
MRLLIGLDRREGGRDALELARVLCGDRGGSALVATVLYSDPLLLEYAQLPEGEAQEALPLFEQARETLGGIEVETRAYGGSSPAAILTALAEEDGFDAIVVGSPHRGAIGRVLAGSTAINLLNGAPADVAVAPTGYAEARHESPRRIAVGYDGTPEARLALRHAEALALPAGAALEIITVVQPPVTTPVMAPGAYLPELPPRPEKVMSDILAAVDQSLSAEATRRDGDPASEIVRACEEGVDLLVVGSRGSGPLKRVLLGSVSRQLVCKATCPVLVVRRP